MNSTLRFLFASSLLPIALTAQAHEIGAPVEDPVVIGDDIFHPQSVMVLWATACTSDNQRATAYFIVQPSLTDQGRNGAWMKYEDVEIPLQAMWTKAAQEFSSQDFRTENTNADEPGKFPAVVQQAISKYEADFLKEVERASNNVTVRIAKYGYYDRPSGACPMPEVA